MVEESVALSQWNVCEAFKFMDAVYFIVYFSQSRYTRNEKATAVKDVEWPNEHFNHVYARHFLIIKAVLNICVLTISYRLDKGVFLFSL